MRGVNAVSVAGEAQRTAWDGAEEKDRGGGGWWGTHGRRVKGQEGRLRGQSGVTNTAPRLLVRWFQVRVNPRWKPWVPHIGRRRARESIVLPCMTSGRRRKLLRPLCGLRRAAGLASRPQASCPSFPPPAPSP